jgi:zinc-binding alcohol dehydrogenase/oxidoreductase
MEATMKRKTMKAIVYDSSYDKSPVNLKTISVPEPGVGEVLVNLKAAAMNRRDFYILNRAPFTKNWAPFVPGSDGAGVVTKLGENVEGWDIGDQVIINPFLFCGQCEYCIEGKHALCVEDEDLGGPRNGTFAEYIAIPTKNLLKKPEHLTMLEAAALPLALGTAWRVLVSQGRLARSETLLIQGIGSGVATFMLQIAVAMGVKVLVTSGSDGKLKAAMKMGAAGGINYKEENVVERVLELTDRRGVDLVADSSGKASFKDSVASLRKGGRVVAFGTTTGLMEISFVDLVMKQASLITSNMLGKTELEDAVSFYSENRLMPVISEVLPLEDVQQAVEQMSVHSQFGKLLLIM